MPRARNFEKRNINSDKKGGKMENAKTDFDKFGNRYCVECGKIKRTNEEENSLFKSRKTGKMLPVCPACAKTLDTGYYEGRLI